MVEVDGGLVPFFITEEGINFRTPTSLSLAFDDIDTAEKVRPYCGCKIYLPSGADPLQESGTELNVLVGYNVFDRERGNLGEIIRVDDFSGNIVLTIEHGTKEIMVPLSEDLIVEYREEEKEIYLDCPEGLIDLYLE